MIERNNKRRYIYQNTFDEVSEWANKMRKAGILEKAPNQRENFPFELEQYIRHLKMLAKSQGNR